MTGQSELKELCDSLLIRKEKVAVFCGAGISYNSNIPLVYHIVKGLLLRLGANTIETEKIASAGVPFEVFMELFKEHIDIDPIFDLFRDKIQNFDHKFIAGLAQSGYCSVIVTTNFDQLIEQSLEDEGLIEKTDFEIYASDEEIAAIIWESSLIKVIKVHGTVSSVNSIKILMSKIASSSISVNLKETIQHTFSTGTHAEVIVLGYSCSDHFDISPILENISGPYKKVFFIEHDRLSTDPETSTAEDIKIKNFNNPFKYFEGSTRIIAETEGALHFLASNLGITTRPITAIPDYDWNSPLDDVFKTISKDQFNYLVNHTLGRLLIKSANYDLAVLRMTQSAADALATKDYFFVAQGHLNAGIANYRQAKHIQAINQYKMVLRTLKNFDIGKPERYEKFIRANTLGNVGNVLYSIRKLRFAEYFQLAALKLAEDEQFNQLIANTNGNLGIIYFENNDFFNALKYHGDALIKADQIGDIEGIERHNYNLGCAEMQLGHFGKMHKCFKRAGEMCVLLGRPDSQAYLDLELGKYYIERKNYRKARLFLRRVFKAVEQKMAQLVELDCYEYLGDTYRGLGNKSKALKFYGLGSDYCLNSEILKFQLRVKGIEDKMKLII